VLAAPAPRSAAPPRATKRTLGPDCDAPPAPVCGAPVGMTEGVVLADAATVEVVVDPAVVGVVVVVHADAEMVSVSRVTAPFLASTRPLTVTLLVTVMSCNARIVPRKLEPVPRVAELPTCQKTLQGWAPLINVTWLAEAVVRVEPAWKTKTAFASPCHRA
jgi:hypothetical protein